MRCVASALALALLGTSSEQTIAASLEATARSYYANLAAVAAVTSRDTVMDYYQRLLDDKHLLDEPAPEGYPAPLWQQTARTISRLDISLASQLMNRTFAPMASIRGLEETFVRSSLDGTMQPVAVYVPPSYVPGKSAPLAVFLHGNPQPESQLMGQKFISDLADRTGTIVVAPYGRGNYDFGGSEKDVYDALDAATHAFTIDPRRRYLVGYSMGGFSVFLLAPMHPDDWSAVMCISGSLLGSRAHTVVSEMQRTPFYVLTGTLDTSIPTQYPTSTAIYLRDMGLPVTFYSQPNGTHRLLSLLPILERAWDDMHHGVVRSPTELAGGFTLPSAVPTMTLKP